MITLTPEQLKAHDHVLDWLKSRGKLLTLGGYAGVGKTTLTAAIARTLKGDGRRLAFCTVSGKASTVLKAKLGQVLGEGDYCGTIHSLIYQLIGKEKLRSGRTELYFDAKQDAKLPFDLLIVDEASMVNEWIYRDLSAYGIPILAVGDHGQLPPVKGTFNLMENPAIRLETIMRQAEGNPIIAMSRQAREEGMITYGDKGEGCIKTRDTKVLHEHDYGRDSIMLCGINKTRVRMNAFARDRLKIADPCPVVGEPVICLYNNRKKAIYNGNIGILDQIESIECGYEVRIDFGDFNYFGWADHTQFGREYTHVDDKLEDIDFFDWAYCITTHKAQGSEWKNVLVIEEGEFMFKGDLWRRWLYTACTRAKEKLIIYKR